MLLGDGPGGAGERLGVYLVERARGGAAMVSIETAPVHPASLYARGQVRLYDDAVVPGLARIAERVHAAGSTLSVILWHGGPHLSFRSGRPSIAASAVPSLRGEIPRSATRAGIDELVGAYGAAAARCRVAGLDAVELQTASDYFLGTFLSPTLNRRTDEYGGSLENRTRIVREILESIRENAGPGVAVGVRTSASHLVPGDDAGYGLDESVAAMSLLAGSELVDWVSVITGSYWAFDRVIAPMATPRAAVAEEAAEFRRALSVPVIVAGRIRTAAEAEEILASEQADVIAMARTWIADPEWLVKIERGEEDRIRPCISCNQACTGFVARDLTGTCTVNPLAGHELEFEPLVSAPRRCSISVVGGGPAGLEVARVAALRGFDVTLYEAHDRVGGEMRLAAEAPHRSEITEALDWWERELTLLGVEVRHGERVDSEDLDTDQTVWAVGAQPAVTGVWRLRPHLVAGIPGAGALPHGRDILRGERSVSGDVLIIDEEGGWPAVSVVEFIAAQPETASASVVTSYPTLGEPEFGYTLELEAVSQRLAEAGVSVRSAALVESVEGGLATLAGGEQLGNFDAVVLCTGTAAPLLASGLLAVGDCVAPRGFWAAVNDAARLARDL